MKIKLLTLNFKKLFFYFIHNLGIVYMIRYTCSCLLNNPVRIIFSHRVIDNGEKFYEFFKRSGDLTVDEFENRIKYLNKHFRFISLSEFYLQSLQENSRKRNLLALTFDDGYKCFYKNVYPILKKYNIPATLFLTVGCIEQDNLLWYDKVIVMLNTAKVKSFRIEDLADKLYYIRNTPEIVNCYNEIVSQLKMLDRDKRDLIIDSLYETFKIMPNDVYIEEQMVTWQDIKEMIDSGLVTIGAHTVSHPILTKLPIENAGEEIRYSKKIIEDRIHASVDFFAYPNGKPDDYNDQIKKVVKDSGFLLAFTTNENIRDPFDRFSIPRYGLSNEYFYRFTLRLSGMLDMLQWFKKKIGKLTLFTNEKS